MMNPRIYMFTPNRHNLFMAEIERGLTFDKLDNFFSYNNKESHSLRL